MPNDYTLKKVYLQELELELLIIKMPEADIQDKLTIFTSERGRITEALYSDFIVANFIANINSFISRMAIVSLETKLDLNELREKLINIVIDINPILDPENLIINRNYVVKFKGDVLGDDEMPLKDSKYWNVTPEEEYGDAYAINIDKVLDVEEEKKENKITDISKLKFEKKDIWWERVGKYISIKKFDESAKELILTQRHFHTTINFETFINNVCLIDVEILYSFLDTLGITNSMTTPALTHELYKLCLKVNPFLTYENALQLMGIDGDDYDDDKLMTTTVAGTANSYSKRKPKRTFKSVPKSELLSLGDNMKLSLKGQDEAIDKLMEAILRASIGLKDPVKPIGSFLFAGRTGVGKTLATKILSNELTRGRDSLITIDCSEYTADHEYSKLIGAPSGYLGHESGGILTNAIAKNPFSIVVFDEVEKASHKVHQLLLQILEEGRLTDGKGKTVSFKEAIIILTSNVGVKEVDSIKKTVGFGNVAVITDKKKDRAINEALKSKFKPEFLNRIDSIIYFKNLTDDDYMDIIDLELAKLKTYLRDNESDYSKIDLRFNKPLKKYIFDNGVDAEYGARPIKRCIEKNISTNLAKKLLSEDVAKDAIITVSMRKGEVTFKVLKTSAARKKGKAIKKEV